jgi:hypothetical protein
MNPWSALLNGGMLAQGGSGSNAAGHFEEFGDGSRMALRFSLPDLGSLRARVK